jgi:hypothetical protein
MPAGSTSDVPIILDRNSNTGNVALTADGVPSGITVTFTPATVLGDLLTSTMRVVVSESLSPGTYSFQVNGSHSSVDVCGITFVVDVKEYLQPPCDPPGTPQITTATSVSFTTPQAKICWETTFLTGTSIWLKTKIFFFFTFLHV